MRILSTFALATALAATPAAMAQNPQQEERTRERSDAEVKVIYGKLKELTKGTKIVIALENSPDREYSFNDPKTSVNVAEGLALGDHVRITESKRGENRHVEIARQTPGQAK
jgi:hypothetical protein